MNAADLSQAEPSKMLTFASASKQFLGRAPFQLQSEQVISSAGAGAESSSVVPGGAAASGVTLASGGAASASVASVTGTAVEYPGSGADISYFTDNHPNPATSLDEAYRALGAGYCVSQNKMKT